MQKAECRMMKTEVPYGVIYTEYRALQRLFRCTEYLPHSDVYSSCGVKYNGCIMIMINHRYDLSLYRSSVIQK